MTGTPGRPGAVDAGVFVAALVLFFASVAQGWTVLAWLSGVSSRSWARCAYTMQPGYCQLRLLYSNKCAG